MTRTDREVVHDAFDHLGILRQHLVRGDLDDQTIADVVSLLLASAIETISHGTDDLRDRLFAGEWHIVWATRNRIVHSYTYINQDIIRATVAEDLPSFEAALTAELERADS